jgi:hypothetical protein
MSRKAPQTIQARRSFFFRCPICEAEFTARDKYPLLFSERIAKGVSSRAARICLTALNVIGGITSFPSFCDMNPDPHRAAVRSRARFPLVLSFIVYLFLSLICSALQIQAKRMMLFYNHAYSESRQVVKIQLFA